MLVWSPGDTGCDCLPAQSVGRMMAHTQVREPLPVFGYIVPYVFDSGTSGLRKGTTISHAPHS
jgi:hypothetical protein